ncbi:MAG: hypothetical protein IBX57_00990 [Gammaproteobacteria bacterium]|nr:hypothetical protein [Gammaproteobacteria bacterium]
MSRFTKAAFSLLKKGIKVKRSFNPSLITPGSNVLIGGDDTHGFYGEVPNEDFITPQELCDLTGYYQGTLTDNSDGWLKFIIDGKIIFYPKRRIRMSVNWNSIYAAGMVYGDDTFGTYPSTIDTLQDKRITVGDNVFKVRLLKLNKPEPVDYTGKLGHAQYNFLRDSEYGKIFFNIIDETESGFDKWATYPLSIIGEGVEWQFTMEGSARTRPLGFYSMGYVHTSDFTKSATYGTFCWRPILELDI